VVRGLAFGTFQCNDVAVNGELPEPDPGVPARDVRLVFRQGGEEWDLGTVDADPELSFEVRARVPEGASPGPARIDATNGPFGQTGTRFRVLGAAGTGGATSGAAAASLGRQCVSLDEPCEDDPGANAPNVLGLTDAECGELLGQVGAGSGVEERIPADQMRYCLHALGSRGVP
jgi:hypothetical protein